MAHDIIQSIHLHLGAHKTASTYLQKKLRNNLDPLSRRKVLFLGPRAVKGSLGNAIISSEHPDRCNARLDPAADTSLFDQIFSGNAPRPVEHLVLSDENLLSHIRYIYEVGALYPGLKKRMELTREYFSNYTDCQPNIFFCIRDYSTLLPSLYCEFIRHNPFVPFPEFIGKIDIHTDISWVPVLDIFSEVFGAENITLWKFEDFRDKEAQVFEAFCGVDNTELEDLEEESVRVSVSWEAIKALEFLCRTFDPEEVQKRVPVVSDRYSLADGNSKFAPFSDADREMLASRYSEDCAALANRFKLI